MFKVHFWVLGSGYICRFTYLQQFNILRILTGFYQELCSSSKNLFARSVIHTVLGAGSITPVLNNIWSNNKGYWVITPYNAVPKPTIKLMVGNTFYCCGKIVNWTPDTNGSFRKLHITRMYNVRIVTIIGLYGHIFSKFLDNLLLAKF